MKAAYIERLGNIESLKIGELPKPIPNRQRNFD
jgi:hypothetical protein